MTLGMRAKSFGDQHLVINAEASARTINASIIQTSSHQ